MDVVVDVVVANGFPLLVVVDVYVDGSTQSFCYSKLSLIFKITLILSL